MQRVLISEGIVAFSSGGIESLPRGRRLSDPRLGSDVAAQWTVAAPPWLRKRLVDARDARETSPTSDQPVASRCQFLYHCSMPAIPPTKPFLKWAGRKHRLLNRISEVLPRGRRLVEPFAGSLAVSLGLDYPRYLVADANEPLISLYHHLQREGEDFIGYCQRYFKASNNNREVFYRLRVRYNSTTNPRVKAALLVWLNRHAYNGLYRVNASGEFNVPFGRYTQPYFPSQEMLAFVERSRAITFVNQDYRTTLQSLREGDVVYCDPPYVPLTATAKFTDYAVGGFTAQDQMTLANEARRLAAQGIPVVISNHDTPEVRSLYAGATLETFQVRRVISQNATQRGHAGELLALFI